MNEVANRLETIRHAIVKSTSPETPAPTAQAV
jgi:hypothetical protein